MSTLGQIVDDAHFEIGIGEEATAAERSRALRRLQQMLAEWDRAGVRVGFNLDGDLDADSGIPKRAERAIVCGLAIEIAPAFGKSPSQDTRNAARDGYEALLVDAAKPQPQQLPDTLPMGAGNRGWPWNRTFFPTPTDDPLLVTTGGDVEITS